MQKQILNAEFESLVEREKDDERFSYVVVLQRGYEFRNIKANEALKMILIGATIYYDCILRGPRSQEIFEG